MPRSISVKQGSIFKNVVQAYVRQGGVWKSPTEIYIKQNGVWKLVYPEEAGSIAYTTPGAYSFTVPSGRTSLTCSVYGAGGGGGSPQFCGDGWVGGGGSSGGYIINSAISVIPGETLTIAVGQGGVGGVYPGLCVFNQNPGLPGGNSSVSRGAAVLTIATGGGGGGFGLGSNGPAGSPNGVQGQEPCNPGNCGYGFNAPRAGGNNGTGYGIGGNGGYFGGEAQTGGNGAVFISWG